VSGVSEIGYIVYTDRRKLYGFSNLFVGILWSSKCAKCGDKYMRQYVEAIIITSPQAEHNSNPDCRLLQSEHLSSFSRGR
jgi:hypothetical protein